MRRTLLALGGCLAVLALGVWSGLDPPAFVGGARDAVVSSVVNRVGMFEVTVWAMSFFSTIPERVVLFFSCSVVLAAAFFLARCFRSLVLRFLVPVLSAFFVFLALYLVVPRIHAIGTAAALALIVGVGQVPSWRRRHAPQGRIGFLALVAGIILAPALAVALLDGWKLISLARRLHADHAVRQVAAIDLNAVEIDTVQGLLFTNGHGTNHLLAYNLHALDQAPRKSEVEVGFAQGFTYDRPEGELYVFNPMTASLLILDAMTLALKKSVSGLDLSEGDCYIEIDRHTDEVIIASEAGWPARQPGQSESPTASPIVVVERTTGRPRALRECNGFCNPAHILLHPDKGLLYMSFIDHVLAYDTGLGKIVASTKAGDRWMGGQLLLTPDGKELLAPSPLHSAVLRFDAETLELKGRIRTVFGVRGLAIDPARKLLLAVSGLTNMLDVIDLTAGKRLTTYYVAPWLRTIALDSDAGTAYVSSVTGLFRVDYKRRL